MNCEKCLKKVLFIYFNFNLCYNLVVDKKVVILKKIFVFIMFLVVLTPNIVNAVNINEYPPYVNVKNEELYDIEKIINDEEVVVRLKKKNELTYYSWSFDKDKVGDKINLDFEITFEDDEKIEKLLEDDIEVKYLNFKHHGTLPSNAKVTVYVGDKFKDKTNLYLYYYNEDTEKIEYISKDIKVSNGYIEFEIEHCSKYFVTTSLLDVEDVVTSKSFNYVLLFLIVAAVLFIGKVLIENNEMKEA